MNRLVFWAPRALALALIVFVSLFALDVFEEGLGFWATLGHLAIHLIPSFVLVAVLAVAWRREWVGAVLFALAGVGFLFIVRAPWWGKATFALPCFVMAWLFGVNWRVRRAAALVFAALLLAAAPNARADDVQWNDLAPLIVGRDVAIPVAGRTIRGEALSVRADSLLVAERREQTTIPRSDITEIRVARQGSGGRILGTILGVLIGIVAGAETAVHATTSEAAGVSAFTGVAAASTVAGYYAGRSIDRRWKLIRVAATPESVR